MFPKVTDFRKQRKSNFIFAHININSYRNKFVYVSDLLFKRKVDNLAVSETKLDASFPLAQFSVNGYVVYRQDLTSSSGGLLIYIRYDLPHRRLLNAELNNAEFESIVLEVTLGKMKTLTGCIYKHPKASNTFFSECMRRLSDVLFCDYNDIIYLGDMNCCPTKSNVIHDLCDLYCLTNLIKEATCHKGANPSILDIILVSNPRRYAAVLNAECPISDFYNIIGAATKRFAPLKTPRQILYRSYKTFNEIDFINYIESAPFHVMDIFDDVDDMVHQHPNQGCN